MKRTLVASVIVSVCLGSGAAAAQEFGAPGQVVLGAERLTGVYSDHLKSTTTLTDIDGNPTGTEVETSTDSTSISLLGVPTVIGDSPMNLPSSTPRLALDVFVAPGLSIGGSFVYMRRTGSQDRKYTPSTAGTNRNEDLPTGSTLLFSPRIGYAALVTPGFAIWPRAGITYTNYRMTEEETDSDGIQTTYKASLDFTTASLEVMAAAIAVPHFAFLFGPFLDLPLGGSTKATIDGTSQRDAPKLRYWSVGLSVGVAGYF